jgi:hypothetical protein
MDGGFRIFMPLRWRFAEPLASAPRLCPSPTLQDERLRMERVWREHEIVSEPCSASSAGELPKWSQQREEIE